MLEYLISAVVLTAFLVVVAGPSLIAIYRWWFGGGKLLNDRLGDGRTLPFRERR
ncbi:MAG TPA: hypothetical protein VMW91_03240 [Desulfosporosinus sp.]|jgi:hypothetical protein|nr:hypothetical protein [Desulfosporosinus sp.]